MVPAAEFFNRSIDSVMLYMHGYKNKTYKREDIYTSFTCKSWGPPIGHQLLCGTAISVQPERGFMLYSVISFTQYYCCRMCFTKEQFHYQKTEDLAPGTWEFEFSRKAALTYLPWQCKFRNQEKGEQNHFTAGGVFPTPQWYTEGLWPDTTKHSEAVLSFKHASSSVAPVELLACLTASTCLNVWLKQGLD